VGIVVRVVAGIARMDSKNLLKRRNEFVAFDPGSTTNKKRKQILSETKK
jgi:hypothetical protein